MRTSTMLAGALGVFLAASPLYGQTFPGAGEAPRLHGGVTVLGAAPRGDFGDQIERAFGLGGHLRYQLDEAGRVAIRLDGSWLGYGWDDQDVALSSPLGGTQLVNLSTSYHLVFVGVGPEVSTWMGGVNPYLGADAGFAYFLTDATADRRTGNVRVDTHLQQDDLVLAYGAHGGFRIPLAAGGRSLSLDLGARYQHSDRAEFVSEGGLRVTEAGTITLNPVQANADVWVFSAGISLPLEGDR